MTSEAVPIPLDRSDIAWLEARHPRSAIEELFASGRFVNVEHEKSVVNNVSNNSKNP